MPHGHGAGESCNPCLEEGRSHPATWFLIHRDHCHGHFCTFHFIKKVVLMVESAPDDMANVKGAWMDMDDMRDFHDTLEVA